MSGEHENWNGCTVFRKLLWYQTSRESVRQVQICYMHANGLSDIRNTAELPKRSRRAPQVERKILRYKYLMKLVHCIQTAPRINKFCLTWGQIFYAQFQGLKTISWIRLTYRDASQLLHISSQLTVPSPQNYHRLENSSKQTHRQEQKFIKNPLWRDNSWCHLFCFY
jgi:hypothetical protein